MRDAGAVEVWMAVAVALVLELVERLAAAAAMAVLATAAEAETAFAPQTTLRRVRVGVRSSLKMAAQPATPRPPGSPDGLRSWRRSSHGGCRGDCLAGCQNDCLADLSF